MSLWSFPILCCRPSSLGKAVFHERALTLGQGQFTKNKQIAKLSLWSGAGTSNMGRRSRWQRRRSHPSHPPGFFHSSSKVSSLNTPSWETTAADSIVLMCICQSKQES